MRSRNRVQQQQICELCVSSPWETQQPHEQHCPARKEYALMEEKNGLYPCPRKLYQLVESLGVRMVSSAYAVYVPRSVALAVKYLDTKVILRRVIVALDRNPELLDAAITFDVLVGDANRHDGKVFLMSLAQ